MLLQRIFPKLPDISWQPLTAFAIASGVGAASGCGMLPWYLIFLILIIPLFCHHKYTGLMAFAVGLCAFGAGLWHQKCENGQFPPGSGYYRGTLTVRDTRLTGVENINQPKYIRCDFSGKEGSGKVIALLPADFAPPLYGDRLEVDGILTAPQVAGYYFDGTVIGEEIVSSFPSQWLFRVRNCKRAAGEQGLLRWMILCREKVLGCLLSGVEARENRSMAARLFAGAGNGAMPETKRDFVLAGVIHLFAVSGLHVGVLAALVLFVMRGMPMRVTGCVAAAVVAAYVVMTGCSMSALRAGMMIVVWLLLRSWLYYIPAWNVLCASWTLLMLFAPHTAGDMGVQYSYGITAALLWGLGRYAAWRQETRQWYEDVMQRSKSPFIKRKMRLKRYKRKVVESVLVAILGFAGGSGISLIRQFLLLPGSILANIVIVPLLPLLFVVMFLKIFFCAAGKVVDGFFGSLLELSFQTLSRTAAFFAGTFDNIESPSPALWEIIIFYILFYFALSCKIKKAALISGISALVLLLSFPLRGVFEGPKLIFISSGSNRPLMAAYLPGGMGKMVRVCNVPDGSSGFLMAELLRKYGKDEAEIVFSGHWVRMANGVKSFCNTFPVKTIYAPPVRYGRFFRKRLSGSGVPSVSAKTPFLPEYSRPERFKWHFAAGFYLEADDLYEGRSIKVFKHEKEIVRMTIPWCNEKLVNVREI